MSMSKSLLHDHHLIPQALIADVRRLVGMEFDIDKSALNRVFAVGDRNLAATANRPWHNQHKSSGYTDGVRLELQRIGRLPEAQRLAALNELAGALRLGYERNAFALTAAAGTPDADRTARFFADLAEFRAQNQSAIAAINQRALANGPLANDRSRLVGFDPNAATINALFDKGRLNQHQMNLLTDVSRTLPAPPGGWHPKLEQIRSLGPIAKTLGRNLDKFGFIGDVLTVATTFAAAKAAQDRGDQNGANRLWAEYFAELIGGGLGAAAGAVFGPLGALAGATIGGEAASRGVLFLYDNYPEFQAFVGGLAQNVDIMTQLPQAVATVFGSKDGGVFHFKQGDRVVGTMSFVNGEFRLSGPGLPSFTQQLSKLNPVDPGNWFKYRSHFGFDAGPLQPNLTKVSVQGPASGYQLWETDPITGERVESYVVQLGRKSEVYMTSTEAAEYFRLRDLKYDVAVDDGGIVVPDTELAKQAKAYATARDTASAGQLGSIFGSALAKTLQLEDPWAALGAGTLIGTIGMNIGQELHAAAYARRNPGKAAITDGFENFPADLASAGLGAIGSYLLAEMVAEWGLGEFATGAVNSGLGAVVGQIADNLVNGVAWSSGLGQSALYLNAAASFIGTYLASELVEFDSLYGQIGASLGSALGTFAAVKLGAKIGTVGGFVGIAIGAFIGYIAGGLIGSLMGASKAYASVEWNAAAGRYDVMDVRAKRGGSKEAASAVAGAVAEGLNGVLDATGAKLLVAPALQQFGMRNSEFMYWNAPAGAVSRSRDVGDIVGSGVRVGLDHMLGALAGGDVYAKRALGASLALQNGAEFELQALLGDLQVAKDYGSYVQAAGTIGLLYDAAPDSAFAAGWTITFVRAAELGLDRRAFTDWIGGWGVFLDETRDGAIDGKAWSASSLVLELDADTNERLFVFLNADGTLAGVLGDTIDTAGKTIVAGGTAADVITVSGTTLTSTAGLLIDGAAPVAATHVVEVAAVIDGGEGDDRIEGGDLGNDLLGGAGDDTLVGGVLDDWLFGGEGNDVLHSADAAKPPAAGRLSNGDYLNGGAGDDRAYGYAGSEWLVGGDGADTLDAGGGGDVLAGSAGLDSLKGGEGSDQYVFGFGDGRDTLFDSGDPGDQAGWTGSDSVTSRIIAIGSDWSKRTWAGGGAFELDGSVKGGEDAISFGPGVTMANIKLLRVGPDLEIRLIAEATTGEWLDTGDVLVVQDWFETTRRIEWLRFADGEEFRIGDMTSFAIGSGNADVILGSAGRDFVYGGGGDDDIRLLDGQDFGNGGSGNDFVSGDADNDLVMGGSGDDIVVGGTAHDVLFGDAGHDKLLGGTGDDISSGGRGQDTVVGGAGNDVFKFSRGDGVDVVLDDLVDNWDVVKDVNGYQNGYVEVGGQVLKDGVVYYDGTEWINGEYEWTQETRVLRRHKGAVNGVLARNNGVDTLEFAIGIDIQDLALRRIGADLEVAVGSEQGDATFLGATDRITIKDWFGSAGLPGAGVERFVFAATGLHDWTGWTVGSYASDAAETTVGGTGKDWLTGAGGDDFVDGSSGDDILAGNAGLDTLQGGLGLDVLYGGAGDDVLVGGSGADVLVGGDGFDIASYREGTTQVRAFLKSTISNNRTAAGDAFYSMEGVEGSSSNDILGGDDGANRLIGSGGNDTLYGGKGDDTYVFNKGDGTDIVSEGDYSIEEIMTAAGVLDSRFVMEWTPLGQHTDGFWYYRLVVWEGADRTTPVYESRDRIDFRFTTGDIQPRPAGGTWPTANGQFKQGYARTQNGAQVVRVVTTPTEADGSDTIEFGAGISLADIAYSKVSGLHHRFTIGADIVQITGRSGLPSPVETLLFADGLSVDFTLLRSTSGTGSGDDLVLATVNADNIAGHAGDDVLSGFGGDDVLAGGDGDDVLEGGVGADRMDGGTDGVTAAAPAGPGQRGDTLRYATSTAALSLDLAPVALSDGTLAVAVSGGHADGDVIAVTNGVSSIENVTGTDGFGDTIKGDSRDNRLSGLGGADVLEARAGDDVLSGGDGADTLSGGLGDDNLAGDADADLLNGDDGKDFLAGGAGADTGYGGAGADELVLGDDDDSGFGGLDGDQLFGGDGHDALRGEDGDDALAGDAGDDLLVGGGGADTLFGGAGSDVMQGGAGSDVYVLDVAAGADVVVDGDGIDKFVFADASPGGVWLTRTGDDLVVSVIGTDRRLTISAFYAPGGVRSGQLVVADKILYLEHVEPLRQAMASASSVLPTQMPSSVTALLPEYWHQDGEAAPKVGDATASGAEDGLVTGTTLVVDHDGDARSFTVAEGAAFGTVTIDAATGVWTYRPDANWSGVDEFKVKVRDAAGHEAVQTVTVTVAPVNDAPTDVTASALAPAIAERDKVADGTLRPALRVAVLGGVDIDSLATQLTFSTDSSSFEVIGNELWLKAGASLDYESGAQISVRVTVRDQAGAPFSKDIWFNVSDVVDHWDGTADPDVLTGQMNRDLIYGYNGDDRLDGGSGADDVFGGAGKDTLYGGAGADKVWGELGADWADGGDGADTLSGGGDHDSLYGGADADVVGGDDGNDVLDGGAADDALSGGEGFDTLAGGVGLDSLSGGGGDDRLDGGAGADRFNFGLGRDTLSYAASAAGVTVDLNTLSGLGGDAQGDVFEDRAEVLIGSAHADTLKGAVGDDSIEAGSGNDEVHGGDGSDTLLGGDGDDALYAGPGGDRLVGGRGRDTLVGSTGDDAYWVDADSGADVVVEFDPTGLDDDALSFQSIDGRQLWFEKLGADLRISVVGTSASVTVQGWWDPAMNTGGANAKLEFVFGGTLVTKHVNVDGLVSLMAGHLKPDTQDAFNALQGSEPFKTSWQSHWGQNTPPALQLLPGYIIQEDATGASASVQIRVTDDRPELIQQTALGLVSDSAGLLQTVHFGPVDANGYLTMTFVLRRNASGVSTITLSAFDGAAGSTRSFNLTVQPAPDAPSIIRANSPGGTFDGANAVWLDIQAELNDPSETLAEIEISNVPTGLTLSKGTNKGGGVWSLTPADLSNLYLDGPGDRWQDLSGTSALRVRARSQVSPGSSAWSDHTSFSVVVNARPTDIGGTLAVNESTNESGVIATGVDVGQLIGTDPDGDALTYRLLDDAGGRFTLTAGGLLEVANGALLNREGPATYIRVEAKDTSGLLFEKTLQVTINNVNERPLAPWEVSRPFWRVDEGHQAGGVTATLGAADPDGTAPTLSLLNNPDNAFELVGTELRLKPGVHLDYDTLAASWGSADYDGDGRQQTVLVVWVRASDGQYVADQQVHLHVQDVNERPDAWDQSGFSVSELAPDAEQTVIGRFTNWRDTDRNPEYGTVRFDLVGGRNDLFSINSSTGEIKLSQRVDYEQAQAHQVIVRVTDAAGAFDDATVTIAVEPRNEAPTIGYQAVSGGVRLTGSDPDWGDGVSHYGVTDAQHYYAYSKDYYADDRFDEYPSPIITPISGAGFITDFNYIENKGTYTVQELGGSGSESPNPRGRDQRYVETKENYYRVEVRSVDNNQAQSQALALWVRRNSVYQAPIGLDLGGDGLDLVALHASSVHFDMNGDGERDRTGWVGASDALLALDRNGNGLIDDGAEISFDTDLDTARTDLEGLAAFDTNEDGQITAADARWSEFRVWQDLNQDGVSQTDELRTLDAAGLEFINLTLETSNPSPPVVGLNYVHGTTSIRIGGALSRATDLFLAYEIWTISEDSPFGPAGFTAPIVLDLNDNGLELVSRADSAVRFDMDGDGDGERTGWVGAGDGLLALDRDGDGKITSGKEISFIDEWDGATSDLDGLRAFDTDGDGFFGVGDARFGEFKVWRDKNQDGKSQTGELTTLAEAGVKAIDLTLTASGDPLDPADNRVFGKAFFVRHDGSTGLVGDVALAHDLPDTGEVPDVAAEPEPASSDFDEPTPLDLMRDALNLHGRSLTLLDHDGLVRDRGEIDFWRETVSSTMGTVARTPVDRRAGGGRNRSVERPAAAAEAGPRRRSAPTPHPVDRAGGNDLPDVPTASSAPAARSRPDPRTLPVDTSKMFGVAVEGTDPERGVQRSGRTSALDESLALGARTRLQMIDAIAAFGAVGDAAADTNWKSLRERRAPELLTALPDFQVR